MEDVTRPPALVLTSIVALLLSPFAWWACRELGLRYAQWKYTLEFETGTKRQAIENRLLSEGIRFFPVGPNVDFVSVGNEVSYSFACAPRGVGLRLVFGMRGASLGAEVLESVKPVREERGCM
jgi:hypothetical protein